ncbi:hypothetical protein Tco_0770106 [Tanacetum coccineum]|uniref:Uncharacterized protein n=1 Tax=Tanacetum coccineum TaxID=301880 RepID=A0ABQ4ZC74_9ASTR
MASTDTGNSMVVEDKSFKKISPMAEEIIAMLREGLQNKSSLSDSDSELLIQTPWSDESKNEKRAKRWRKEFEWKRSLFEIDLTFGINAFDLDKGTEVSQEHVCEEEVPLNNNIGKQSGDLVEMPSEVVEQGMNDHVPDEIDGA